MADALPVLGLVAPVFLLGVAVGYQAFARQDQDAREQSAWAAFCRAFDRRSR